MSSSVLQGLISKEIRTLNQRIDRKIMQGRPYKKDAEKHRALLAQLRRIALRNQRTVSIASLLTV